MPGGIDRRCRAGAIALGAACAIQCAWAFAGEPPSGPAPGVADAAEAALPSERRATPPAERPATIAAILGDLRGLKSGTSGIGLRGFVQTELAHTYANPEHWSKMRVRGELSAQGRIGEVTWKLSGRAGYDAVYDVTDFYPREVRDDQRFELVARENYLDYTTGPWAVRFGRQQIVWGEIVGLFFADVVSARDVREFLLPEFEVLRIPQWAVRGEYNGERFHAELLWIPIPSFDEFGRAGSDFFPLVPVNPAGTATQYRGEMRPARTLSNTNYGARVSALHKGWDVSAFYYRSLDTMPTFYRQLVAGPQPTAVFEARHDRITQWGATIAQDFGRVVFKSEAVYTRGRQFNVVRTTDDNGLVRQDNVDWIVALDFTLPRDTRLNLQAFTRMFFSHDPDTLLDKYENGYSAMLTHDFTSMLEGRVLWISSLNRSDWMLRPRLAWRFEKNWRAIAGLDIFHGSPFGFFGRFANRDRAYVELRYSF